MALEVEGEHRRLRALSHPVRLRILSLLTAEPKSGTDLAPELSMSQAAVSYHLRSLAEAGLIELEEVRNVRGGREKMYRLAEVGPAAGTAQDLEANAVTAAAEVLRRIGEFDARSWEVFGDLEAWLDEETWLLHAHAIADVVAKMHEAAKPAGTPGTIRVSATTLLFRETPAKPSRRRQGGAPV